MNCLIVEDQPLISADLRAQMEELGYTCYEAAGTSEAAYHFKTHHFDLILLDLHVKDGISLPLVDYLQITNTDATVILITGSGAFPNGENAVIAPRIDYVLRKPVNPTDLAALAEYSRRMAS